MRIYVIGPVTGIEDDNRPAFMEARGRLMRAGYQPEVPHQFIKRGTPWREAMETSLRHIVNDRPAGIACLNEWQGSKGACVEETVARLHGIPVKTVDEWIAQGKPGMTCGSCVHFAPRHGGFSKNDGVCLMTACTTASDKPIRGVNPCGNGRRYEGVAE